MRFLPSSFSSNQCGERKDWFSGRREQFIRQVMDDFFHLYRSFHALYALYLECQSPKANACADFMSKQSALTREEMGRRLTVIVGSETEKGLLWLLKDLCHMVWPEKEDNRDVQGSFFDWLIGSVFHEAMKLKENMHLLNSYGTAAFRMQDLSDKDSGLPMPLSGPSARLSSLVDLQGLIQHIVSDVMKQMERIGFLLGQAGFIVRIMLPELAPNMLVVRLLAEEEETVRDLWGESIEELFFEMFDGDAVAGFCAVGRSYMHGQWYIQALSAYRSALELDSHCDEAITKVSQIKSLLRENSSLQHMNHVCLYG